MKIGTVYHPEFVGRERFGDKRFSIFSGSGYDAIDYNMTNTEREIYTCSEEELEAAMLSERADIEAAGLFVSQVHGPWRCPPIDSTPADRVERMEKMKRSIRAAYLLGAKFWVVHPIMPNSTADLVLGGADKTWDINIEFFTELVEYAKEMEVIICLENMPFIPFSIATPEQICRLIDAIDDDNFKMCLDTGHVAVFPELSVGDCIRACGDRIRALHIHDNLGDRDSHLYPTRGRINWQDTVSALREIGFDGVFSLEATLDITLSDDELIAEGDKLFRIAKEIIEN